MKHFNLLLSIPSYIYLLGICLVSMGFDLVNPDKSHTSSYINEALSPIEIGTLAEPTDTVNLRIVDTLDCANGSYCATIQIQAAGDSFRIGTSSVLLDYDQNIINYSGYTSLNFDGSDVCVANAAEAWDPHAFDGNSVPGKFNLTLTLKVEEFSCPDIISGSWIDIGTVCFSVIDSTGNPNLAFDVANTNFNSHTPNDGSQAVNKGTFTGINQNFVCSAPATPSITITSPTENQQVAPDVDIVFNIQNWQVQTGGRHFHVIVDGTDQGPVFDTAPYSLTGLAAGPHAVRIELAEADHTLTGVFDEVNFTVCPPAGTACDDGNANTINDVYDNSCNCAGTPTTNNADDRLNLRIADTLDCVNGVYCATIQIQAENDSFRIGTSSILMNYDQSVIGFTGYTSATFDGSDDCINGAADAWDAHVFDGVSVPGSFNLTLSLSSENFSCPEVTSGGWIDIGTVCFSVLDSVGNPNISFDTTNTNFNRHLPNDGSQAITRGTFAGINANFNCPSTASPSITITSPTANQQVGPDVDIVFSIENWDVQPSGRHFHVVVDGADLGPVFSTAPYTLSGLTAGPHTVRLELAEADHTLTGVFDEVTFTVCPPAGTACDDGNANTMNDVYDNNCVCAGTPMTNNGNDQVNLRVTDTLNCGNKTYCATIQIQAESDSFLIGTSSILLNYDQNVLGFSGYTSANFDGSDDCINGAADAWDAHSFDGASVPGTFNLTLTLSSENFSCPEIVSGSWIDIGTVCFTVLDSVGNPNLAFDTTNTNFNRNLPNDGSQAIAKGTFEGISSNFNCPSTAPTVVITAPADNQQVAPDVDIVFTIQNWDIQAAGRHYNYFIDGVDQGAVFTTDPLSLTGLAPGPHTVRIELAETDNTLTGVFDEVTFQVCPPAGTACDDGNANTMNDVYDSNCVCAGTPMTNNGNDRVNLRITDTLNCDTRIYCATIQIQAENDSFLIGTSSILLNYDQNVLAFSDYSSANFDGSDDCINGVADAWDAHVFDGASVAGTFNLTLSLTSEQFSCPEISTGGWLDIGTVCFTVLDSVGNPNLSFNAANTNFNRHLPNDGTQAIPAGTFAGISTNFDCSTSAPPPLVTITSPTDNAQVGTDVDIVFTIENWDVEPAGRHFNYFIDGVDQGPVYLTNPLSLTGLTGGVHTVRIELTEADNTLTGVFDEVTFIVCPPAGTACDDGNFATINDVYDTNCNCAGTPVSSDADVVNLRIIDSLDCGNQGYCATIQIQAATDSFRIGTSSILLSYDNSVLSYQNYTSSSFDGSAFCINNAAAAWDPHAFDGTSVAGSFNLTMTLKTEMFSCPDVISGTWIDIGTVCFSVLDTTGNPNLAFDLNNTNFNRHLPNDGSQSPQNGTFQGISSPFNCNVCPTIGIACDDGNPLTINDSIDANCMCVGEICPPQGTACDDGNPLTINDAYDANCNCVGAPCPPAGTACDDNNPNTINDIYDANCICAGTPTGMDMDTINVRLVDSVNCDSSTYCVGIEVQAAADSFRIGTSSVLLNYNEALLDFVSYTSSNFDGSDMCINGAAPAWDVHAYDGISVPGVFNLTLTLTSDQFSCPDIIQESWVEIGEVCFALLDSVGNPNITIDSASTNFNRHVPNDGTGAIPKGSLVGITDSIPCANCPPPGTLCDDGDSTTFDDVFNDMCMCQGVVPDIVITDPLSGDQVSPNFAVSFTVSNWTISNGGRNLHFLLDGIDQGTYINTDPIVLQNISGGQHEIRLELAEVDNSFIGVWDTVTIFVCPQMGTACDDGDSTTINDVFDENCNCTGVRDCPPAGTMCDDMDPLTINDMYNDSCMCVGTPCPPTGTACDDMNPNTINDVYDANCNCMGTLINCESTGEILFERWDYIDGVLISDMVNSPQYPDFPTSSSVIVGDYEAPSNQGDQFGAKMSAILCPPISGEYIFWIASDDNGGVWISDDQNDLNLSRIAFHNAPVGVRVWDQFATQQSDPVSLEAESLHYIEALYKESTGADHMALGWMRPDGVMEQPIPSQYFRLPQGKINMDPLCRDIEIIALSAEPDLGGTVALNWEVRGVNGQNFSIEKSYDGIGYFEIGRISSGAGQLNYSYQDTTEVQASNYYRIQYLSGESGVCPSRSVLLNFDFEADLDIYPNPSEDDFTISITSEIEQNAGFKIVDALGQVLNEGEFELVPGVNEFDLDATNFSKGIYFIQIKTKLKEEFKAMIKL